MKVFIQEMIRGQVKVVNTDYLNDIVQELVSRKIPFKIDYVYENDIFDTMTQHNKKFVSTAKARESKII